MAASVKNSKDSQLLFVTLSTETHRLLKARAAADGIAMGVYTARLLEAHLEADPLAQRLEKAMMKDEKRQGR